ncbi:fungal hydrophobin SC6 [Schizophyllum commune H4-8]|uniref:Class I hydrophobin SC6 n=2 Tax=Schizophyllum commune TaxID=5334 RepID=SC6_SCHCO|nr:fungal hydrophobin SC6 [Schizophyllum commune H4-8]O74300.1 RecName: Full=Hydrophobin-6; Flags: Precursor [Schizophyllum commune]KAI5894304.1 fungal hydrophobin SC6 [Schizophyllum commune H4-8]CAA07545.1 hydrophobin 6 [Schizophyllum commune]
MVSRVLALISVAMLVGARPYVQNVGDVDLNDVDATVGTGVVDTGMSGDLLAGLLANGLLADLLSEDADGHIPEVTGSSTEEATSSSTWSGASSKPTDSAPTQCNSGTLQCCESTTEAKDIDRVLLSTLLGVDVGSITGLIGKNCSPVSVVGVGAGSTCSTQTVCCDGDSFDGLINLGCKSGNVAV